jgi:hypothetical protein
MERSIPSYTKQETTIDRLRGINVGTLTTLRTFARTNRKNDDGNKPGPARTLSGSCSG